MKDIDGMSLERLLRAQIRTLLLYDLSNKGEEEAIANGNQHIEDLLFMYKDLIRNNKDLTEEAHNEAAEAHRLLYFLDGNADSLLKAIKN